MLQVQFLEKQISQLKKKMLSCSGNQTQGHHQGGAVTLPSELTRRPADGSAKPDQLTIGRMKWYIN